MLTTKQRFRRVGCSSGDLSASGHRTSVTMADRLPTVGAPPRDGCDDGKVLIAIDGTALLHSPMEATRARSLNRLDHVDEADVGVDIYRCPSFPRLQKRCGSQVESQTNCSMTHLETNSISPRVSTDNLTNVSREDLDSGAGGYVGGYAGLIRSVSSKTVDELPPLDLRLGHGYLSPQQATPANNTPHPVSRSTSCPSMASARRSPSPRPVKAGDPEHPPPPQPQQPQQQQPQQQQPQQQQGVRGADDNRGKSGDADAAPADGVAARGRHVAENGPDPGRPPDDRKPAGGAPCEEHPMHTKRLLEKQRDRLSLIKQNGELYRNRDIRFDGRAANEPNYVNIRDIPSAVAEKVMDKSSGGSTRAVHTVQKKCLQWLNSLDNDDSS